MSQPPPIIDAPWSIGRLLTWTQQHFESKAVDAPRLSAELLLAKSLGCRRIELYARFNDLPTDEQRGAFRAMVKAAAEHAPIAHLVGHREFYSLDFIVTPDVLIPRPETELLVERALAWAAEASLPRVDVLDLGTGSGCIAITIAKRLATVHGVASDVSPAALEVARQNVEKHGVADRVTCVEADLLALPEPARPAEGFHVIVSNPPYVAETDRATLPRNVCEYEPHLALFAGADGLAVYRRLAESVASWLAPGGALIVEVGMGQAAAVEALFVETGGLQPMGRHRDLAGIERAVEFAKNP